MGYKNVCLSCRKSFSTGTDATKFETNNCPDCGERLIFYNQRFQPPKKDDLKAWKLIEFLKENGFVFQPIYKDSKMNEENTVPYPTNLAQAKEFVLNYRDQAIKPKE